MRVHHRAVAFAGVAALALAACSQAGSVPAPVAPASQLVPTQSLPAASAIAPDKRDPCNILNLWYFHGSCVKKHMKATGTTFYLKSYKGITVRIRSGPNTASGKVKFIVGDGTGDRDITGLYVHAFPFYGTTYCVQGSASGSHVACPGKSLVYFEVVNNANEPVTLSDTPGITITAASFPGTTCSENVMVFNDYGLAGWQMLGLTGTVHEGQLNIKAVPATQFWNTAIALSPYGFVNYNVACQ